MKLLTAPGNDLILLILTLSILLSSAYAVGRIHQWHKCSLERDEAYRLGYDKASLSILTLMAHQKALEVESSATVTTLAAVPHARRSGRNTRGGRRLSIAQPLRREQCDRVGS